MAPRIQLVQSLEKTGRITRRPKHPFHLRQQPFQIQPFLLAPVLPGESMQSALMQIRIVTDPIKNPLIGWHAEQFLFYVKHRDLAERDNFVDMMLDPTATTSADVGSATPALPHYFGGGGATLQIDWVGKCLAEVVTHYFRDEGETEADHTLNGLPMAKLNSESWTDSLMRTTEVEAGMATVDVTDVGTITKQQEQWELLRQMNMTTMSYEEWLGTYGVSMSKDEPHKPELLRFTRSWSYPTNTVDPTDGDPASAVSWSIAERADKTRFFKEPGFIFGVQVFRPKMYLRHQTSQASMLMKNAMTWLPAIMRDDPATSLVEHASATEPLFTGTVFRWLDIKDLLIHGDQFLNFDPAAVADAGMASLPVVGSSERFYPTEADIDALFVGASPANLVRSDGVVSLAVKGALEDTTPTNIGYV